MVRVVEGKISGGCAWGCAVNRLCCTLLCVLLLAAKERASWVRGGLLGSGAWRRG